jgi:hypothetical protein
MIHDSGDITVRVQVFLTSFVSNKCGKIRGRRLASDQLRRGEFYEAQLQIDFLFGQQR